MSTGSIVTIGGQEVYYSGRPRRPVAGGESVSSSQSLPSQVTVSQPLAEHPPRDKGADLVLGLLMVAGLLIVLTAIVTRNTRRGLQ